MEQITKQNIHKAIFAAIYVFYFTFISLYFFGGFFGTLHHVEYQEAMQNLLTGGTYILHWFSLHFIILIIGFYRGIRNFQKGNKKKIFTLPIIFITSSLLIPGLLPLISTEPYPLPLIFFPPFIQTFIFLLLFTILVSTTFYFQRNQHIFKIVIASFLIFLIFIPLGKSSYEKTKTDLLEYAETQIQKAISLKEEAIKTLNPDLCMQIRDMSDSSLDSDYARIWESSDYAKAWNTSRKEKNLPIPAESYPLKDYSNYYFPCVRDVIEEAKKTENMTFCDKFKDYLMNSECIKFFQSNEFKWIK